MKYILLILTLFFLFSCIRKKKELVKERIFCISKETPSGGMIIDFFKDNTFKYFGASMFSSKKCSGTYNTVNDLIILKHDCSSFEIDTLKIYKDNAYNKKDLIAPFYDFRK